MYPLRIVYLQICIGTHCKGNDMGSCSSGFFTSRIWRTCMSNVVKWINLDIVSNNSVEIDFELRPTWKSSGYLALYLWVVGKDLVGKGASADKPGEGRKGLQCY